VDTNCAIGKPEYEHTKLVSQAIPLTPYQKSSVYAHRTSGGHRHHRYFGESAPACFAKAKEKANRAFCVNNNGNWGWRCTCTRTTMGIKWLFPSSLIRSLTDQDGSTCPFPEEASGGRAPIRPNHPILQPESGVRKRCVVALPEVTRRLPVSNRQDQSAVVETAEQQTFHVRHE